MKLTAIDNAQLSIEPSESLALYIHIPFCATRCYYCAFYLETGFSPRVLNRTLDAIIAEGRYWMHLLGEPAVHSVYIGGGTPSVIPPSRLGEFLTEVDRLRKAGRSTKLQAPDSVLRPVREWTIEVNPESVTDELVDMLNDSPVTRISLGVQSLNDRSLSMLGRRSNAATARRALSRLQTRWRGRLSVDLIAGIPGETPRDIDSHIREVLDAGVRHVSLYGLTVEPETALEQSVRRGDIRMPDRDLHEAIWNRAETSLRSGGLAAYEVSNFAAKGEESIHNQAYWRLDPYLGLGPGAVSTLPVRREGALHAARLEAPDIFSYQSVHRGTLAHGVELLHNRDFLFEHFMNALRTRCGLSASLLSNRFKVDLTKLYESLGESWSGFALRDRRSTPDLQRFRLNSHARSTVDVILPDLMLALEKIYDPDEPQIRRFHSITENAGERRDRRGIPSRDNATGLTRTGEAGRSGLKAGPS